MLDLGYVREHLPEVEERLRQRGMNPGELLGGFRDLDARRRQAITSAETLKAERNKKSEEVGRRKRAGEDAAALMEETKSLREEGERQEKLAARLEEELRSVMSQIPNLPHSSVPVGRSTTMSKPVVGARRQSSPSLQNHIGNWANSSESSTWSARPSFPARDSLCTGIRERSLSGRWPTSCSIYTPRSMDTPRSCRLTW